MVIHNNFTLINTSIEHSPRHHKLMDKREHRRFMFRLVLVGVALFVLMALADRMIEIQVERQQYAQLVQP